MPKHVVQQGECLTSIARKHGVADCDALYQHPQNEALRQRRPSPHQLAPGDEVFVPEREDAKVELRTGKPVKLVATLPRRELKLVLHGAGGAPLANEPFTVEAGEELIGGTTDGDGMLTASVPGGAMLSRVFSAGFNWDVKLGSLDPMKDAPGDGAAGAQARLANLGYYAGRIDGKWGAETTAALHAFQRRHGLDPTGTLDADTRAKLEEVHGS
jgi:hypothetical protein